MPFTLLGSDLSLHFFCLPVSRAFTPRIARLIRRRTPSSHEIAVSSAHRQRGAKRLAALTVPALLRGRVFFLQTTKHFLGWNSRAALDPSLNRIFEFRQFKVFPLLSLFQDQPPEKQLSGSRAVACDPRRLSHLTAAAAARNRYRDPRTRNPRVAFVNFLYPNEERRR